MPDNKKPLCIRRNPSIELLRLLMMVGICIIHATNQKEYFPHWYGYVQNACLWCVDGFVFISGWYGIRLKPSKIVRLCTVALYCATIGVLWRRYIFGPFDSFFTEVWIVYRTFWFLHAFIFVMLLSATINPLFERERTVANDEMVLVGFVPLFLLAFGWSYLPYAPFVRELDWPTTPGLQSFSGVSLLGAYVTARTARYFNIYERIPMSWLLLGGIALIGVGSMGLNEYNSPVAVSIAACAFGLAQKVQLPHWAHRAVFILAPSAFSVYLIHDSVASRLGGFERDLQNMGMSELCILILISGSVFILGLASDWPRRVVGLLCSRGIKAVLDGLDHVYAEGIRLLLRSL